MNGNGHAPRAIDWVTMPDWLSTEEASQISGYEVNYMRRLLRSGKIKAVHKGYMWWIDKASLLEYVTLMESLGNHRFDPRGQDHKTNE